MASPTRDIERGPSFEEKDHVLESENAVASDSTAGESQTHHDGNKVFATIQRFASRFGAEQRGIERVLPEERTDTSLSKIGTLWLSANMTVSTFAIGALAQPVFKLGFVDTALTIVFVNILGILPVSFFSTFGPRFGLRQMVLSRFYFGYHGVKLVAFLNILACLGWSSLNAIVGAQLLASLSSPPAHPLPGWAGVLVIALSTLLVTTLGYRAVHAYERWSWLPPLIIFCVVAAELARLPGVSPAAFSSSSSPSSSTAGAVLGFAASVYGFAAGWTTFAADFTTYQPERRGRPLGGIFWWTFGGLFLPLVCTELLGAAAMTAASSAADAGGHHTALLDAYGASGVGGLLAGILVPPLGGFGRFCAAVLALGAVANNCPNVYSAGLSLQVLTAGSGAAWRVPRLVWSLAGTAAYVAVSVPAYGAFAPWLEDFMLLLGYWVAVYQGVALAEHFVFRRGWGGSGAGYDVGDHDDPARLPPGLAALGAFLAGVLGAVLGMAQVWFAGPVGKLCGGDVGFELAFGFSAVAYLVLRRVERRRFGR